MYAVRFVLSIFLLTVFLYAINIQGARASFLQGSVEQSQFALNKLRPNYMPLLKALRHVVALPSDSYPNSYEGCWKCKTIVVSSSMKTIAIGKRIVCNVMFSRLADGRTYAYFDQPGWIEGKGAVVNSSRIEARVHRMNYYERGDLCETWTAYSQDHFVQIGQRLIVADSFIEQYINGQLVGNYCTISMLYRAD
jgi:hypothetical protein